MGKVPLRSRRRHVISRAWEMADVRALVSIDQLCATGICEISTASAWTGHRTLESTDTILIGTSDCSGELFGIKRQRSRRWGTRRNKRREHISEIRRRYRVMWCDTVVTTFRVGCGLWWAVFGLTEQIRGIQLELSYWTCCFIAREERPGEQLLDRVQV
jgi:hypothetical protein